MFEEFMVMSRRLRWLPASFSIAAAWIWSPALFVSSQVAAERGVGGLFWFVLPNALALVFFGWVAYPLILQYPRGFTLARFMSKYGLRTKFLYMVMMMAIQVCAIAIQILGAGQALEMVTGINYTKLALGLGVLFVLLASINGLRTITFFNVLHLATLIGVGVVALHGIENVDWSWGSQDVFVQFGLQATLVLFAGPLADQQYWQRAFALRDKHNIRRAFTLAALLFAIVPTTFGILGLAQRGITNSDMTTILALNESVARPVIVSALILALVASGSNAVLAFGNIVGDIVFVKHRTRHSLWAMWGAMIAGVCLALFRLRIVDLWLFYGSIRTAAMALTIGAAMGWQMADRWLCRAILAGFLVGLPIYIWWSGVVAVIVMAFLPIVVIIIGRQYDSPTRT